MVRKFVTLHDEKWIKKHCVLRYDETIHEQAWVPKMFNYMSMYNLSVLTEGPMYKLLVSKTIEVTQCLGEPDMTNYGFAYAGYFIPTWLIKAYWETEE